VEVITAAVDGIVDVLLVDSELKPYLERPLSASASPAATRVLAYKDNDVWVRAVAQQIDALCSSAVQEPAVVCGAESSALKLALALIERGVRVTLTGASADALARGLDALRTMAVGQTALLAEPDVHVAATGARLFVPFTGRSGIVDRAVVEALAPGAMVLVAHVGAASPEAIETGLARHVRFVRPDMRAALAAELNALLGARRLARELMGRSEIAGVPVVAGGLIGRRGDVVVDSISRPLRVLGIADGRGAVIYDGFAEYADRVAAVQAAVWRNRFA
jgi:hypothetical protein